MSTSQRVADPLFPGARRFVLLLVAAATGCTSRPEEAPDTPSSRPTPTPPRAQSGSNGSASPQDRKRSEFHGLFVRPDQEGCPADYRGTSEDNSDALSERETGRRYSRTPKLISR
jgi:hypothetical protein